MPRFVDADTIAAINKDAFDFALLIKIQFPRGTQYWTDYGHDLVYDGKTYNHSSALLEVSSVSDRTDLSVGNFTISMSDVDGAISSIVQSQPISGRRVDVWRAIIENGSVSHVIGVQNNGRMSTWSADEDEETAVVNIEVASHWADFMRVSGRRTTLASQKRFYPNDTGFKQAHAVPRKLKWGGS